MVQELQSLLSKKDREIAMLKEKHGEYESLLGDTKQALDQCRETIGEKEEQLERYERMIH